MEDDNRDIDTNEDNELEIDGVSDQDNSAHFNFNIACSLAALLMFHYSEGFGYYANGLSMFVFAYEAYEASQLRTPSKISMVANLLSTTTIFANPLTSLAHIYNFGRSSIKNFEADMGKIKTL